MPEPTTSVLEVENLTKRFPIRAGLFNRVVGHVHAVDGISFAIRRGETLGLVGESGCGKSTAGKTILKLIEPTSGTIRLNGQNITRFGSGEMRPVRRQMQIIFQDPYSSLNPRMSAGEIVREPLIIHNISAAAESHERVAMLFDRVGLQPHQMKAFPHEFSGGQRQRIGIARALAADPRLIIGDEPVSALDVSIQAQVINLLTELQDDLDLSYLFIAHDLTVVEHISHRIAVMYLGRIVELAGTDELFDTPLHPYTVALLSAVPIANPKNRSRQRLLLSGDVPSPVTPPPGCHFHTRCPYAMRRCREEQPVLHQVGGDHWVSCHLHDTGPVHPLPPVDPASGNAGAGVSASRVTGDPAGREPHHRAD